jgi:hypothetical protein
MATQIGSRRGIIDAEHRFFMISAWVMAAVIVAGFSTSIVFGRSTFASPPIFHVHAFVFFGWVVLYLLQTNLVAAGNIRLHKQLGWLTVGWVPAMLVLGTTMTVISLRTHRGPPFFHSNEFLIDNPLSLVYFAGMVAAAIALRKRTDWHRRLMFCGMAVLTGPGSGRILPNPLFIPIAWWVDMAAVLAFPAVAMVIERRRTGRIHDAWWWGVGLLVGSQIVGSLFAFSPAGYAVTRAVLAGTPYEHADLSARMP